MKTLLALFFGVTVAVWAPLVGAQQPAAVVGMPTVEKKLKELPPGPLFWRIENLATLSEAETAAGPTGLAAAISGKVWLFTLGPKGGATPSSTLVAEIGPVPSLDAPEYLLRIMRATGVPGARSQEHSHPGSEAFYVLQGRLGMRTPHGTVHADAGTAMNGHGADMPMQLLSAGTVDLEVLVIFLVDATRPFSSPARFN